MARRTGILKDASRRGEWVELRFMAQAMLEGLLVSVPWGIRRYDVGVEQARQRFRVQVKSTVFPSPGTNHFRFPLSCGRRRYYTAREIDFLVLYLISIDRWYLIPARRLRIGNNFAQHIQITPGRPHGRWMDYEERWDLLRGAKDTPARVKKKKRKRGKSATGPSQGNRDQALHIQNAEKNDV